MPDQETTIYKIDALYPDATLIAQAASLLASGQLVVFPTETVYGLGANALQISAIEQIFAAKGRPYSDPLITHIADAADLETLVAHIPTQAHLLTEAFWPGPLTLILPASPRVPRMVTAGLNTIAVRMPRHPVALALIRAAGLPIAAPSANRFMHISPTTARHALADLQGRVPLILDGGPCEVGVESTIVDLCSPQPTILRPGGVSLEALRSILPEIQLPPKRIAPSSETPAVEEASKAPGQMLIHYAPTIPTYLVDGTAAMMHTIMWAYIHDHHRRKEQVGILIADEDLAAFQDSDAAIYTLGKASDPAQIATHLFAGLRTLEEAGVHIILCRNFDEDGLGLAVRDRLLKATGGKIIRSL